MYDLVIIGGGPTGINVAISAQRAGLNYVVLEKGMLANSIYNFPVNMTFFSTSLKLEIGEVPFISHADKPTRKEALEYYRRLIQSFEIPVQLYEPVTSLDRASDGNSYTVHTERNSYSTHSVVVATGFYDTPRLLDVPGEALPKVKHYYDDAHAYIGQKVLVVGAANSACDAALECWQKGAEVSMAIRSGELYPKVKYWIKPNIENRIKEGSIPTWFHTEVVEIRPREVVLRGPDGLFTIENDFVLAMTGYQPNYPFLESLGLQTDTDDAACMPTHNPDTLETNLPDVYLAGVVCAGLRTGKLFIENTRDHGQIIVDQILSRTSQPETFAK
jgi:thioredoxin reductase (NADPH)